MSKSGIMKLKILSVDVLKGESHPCSVRISANDTSIIIQSANIQGQMY